MTIALVSLCAYLWIVAGVTLGSKFRADIDGTPLDLWVLAIVWPVAVPVAYVHNLLEGD